MIYLYLAAGSELLGRSVDPSSYLHFLAVLMIQFHRKSEIADFEDLVLDQNVLWF